MQDAPKWFPVLGVIYVVNVRNSTERVETKYMHSLVAPDNLVAKVVPRWRCALGTVKRWG